MFLTRLHFCMRENVADGTIDLIFTDPPYGIDGDN